MEMIGKINCYRPVDLILSSIFTINLSNGTTPFVHLINHHEYQSMGYCLPTMIKEILVLYAHYRPTRDEFKMLDKDHRTYVLKGGLLLAKIEKAKPLINDVVKVDWTSDQLQEYNLQVYGSRTKKE